MAFFNVAVGVLQTLVVALGAGLGIWGAINLLEGYGNDNPGAKAQGMTQEELAEALNISLEHLSKMERGKRKPSIDLIVAMACYFHVSTDYLLMGKDHDKVDSRTKLLDVVAQLAEIAKSL